MEQLLDFSNWKEHKVALGTVVGTAIIAWGAAGHMEAKYWTRVEQQQYEQVHLSEPHPAAEMLAQANSQKIDKAMRKMDLYIAASSVRNLDLALYQHQRDEERDGISEISIKRRRDLEAQKSNAEQYLACLRDNRPNCDSYVGPD